MKNMLSTAYVAFVVAGAMVTPVHAVSEGDRTALHAAMLQHIDRQAVNGTYLHMNLANGAVETYVPAKAHPMMFEFGEHYVLCTDFKDKDGKNAMVDFYVAKRGKGYAIFQTEINNRTPLMKLMDSGKVKAIN